MNMKRNDLIIWREKIPDVEKGVFGYVSENINGKVICLYLQQPDKERTKAERTLLGVKASVDADVFE